MGHCASWQPGMDGCGQLPVTCPLCAWGKLLSWAVKLGRVVRAVSSSLSAELSQAPLASCLYYKQ